jgi:hypothetical protein
MSAYASKEDCSTLTGQLPAFLNGRIPTFVDVGGQIR